MKNGRPRVADNKKRKPVSVSLSVQQRAWLARRAKALGIGVSGIVSIIIADAMSRDAA